MEHVEPATESNVDSAEPIRQPKQSRERIITLALLLLILLVGGYLRFSGINWDNFTHLHPDERFLTQVAQRLSGEDSFFDYLRSSESTLNPYNVRNGDGSPTFPLYVYGNFPMTMTRYAAEFAAGFCEGRGGCDLFGRTNLNFIAYDGIHIVGRFLSALVDLIAVLFVFLIGKELYSKRAGLVAAALAACAVMPIQQAHFFTADNWSSATATVAIYFAVLASKRPQYRWYALFGVFLGLSVASRINVAPLAICAGLAAIVWISKHVTSWAELFSKRGFDYLLRATAFVMLAALVSLATFRVTMPYAFADTTIARETVRQQRELELARPVALEEVSASSPSVLLRSVLGFDPQWIEDLEEIQRLQAPDAVFPPATQWANRTPIVFPLTNYLFWGVGIFAGLASLFGCIWAIRQLAQQRPEWRLHLIPVTWTVLYFLFMGTRWVKNNRYFLPLYAPLLVLAGWGLIELWKRAKSPVQRSLATGTLAVVLIGTFAWALSFTSIYRNPVTRHAATEWFFENVPSGATLLYTDEAGEAKEFQLPLKNHLFQTGGIPLSMAFDMPETGRVEGVRFNYLIDEQTSDAPPVWRYTLEQVAFAGTERTEVLSAESTLTLPTPVLPLNQANISAETPLALRVEMVSGGILIANTSRLLNEHWDDPLPARLPSRDGFASYYTGVKDEINNFDGDAPVTWPDSPDKLNDIVRWLNNSDYVVLSSQRAVWSLPRIPLTYPLMIRYYETLFSGELGFEMAAEFHADLNIGPLYISDVAGKIGWGEPPEIGWPPPSDFFAAEEAFSVYDHPPVWIFRKTDAFDAEKARLVLAQADVDNTMFMNPGQATSTPDALMLDSAEFATHQANGTFASLFNPDSLLNRTPLLAAAAWYIMSSLLGLLAFPIVASLFRSLPSRGYAVTRIFSLLVVSYLVWMAASSNILSNGRSSYFLAVAALAALSIVAVLTNRNAISGWLRENKRFIVTVELISISLFLLSLLIRYGNPDVWHVIWGGEKPMDLTYFTATLKSTSFPPYDPWYAGGALNYYYYGFVLLSSLTKLLGIVPTLAYNLAIPLLFSLTGLGAFSVAYDLAVWRGQAEAADLDETLAEPTDELAASETAVESEVSAEADATDTDQAPISTLSSADHLKTVQRRGTVAGIAAIFLSIVLGNLAQLRTIADYLNTDFFYPGNWFWTASRAIMVPDGQVQPITEFPFFTFLYGDLHAHMIALPLTMLALTWVIAMGLGDEGDFGRISPHTLSFFLVGGLTVGVLYPTNSWDWPTYIVLAGLGIFLASLRRFTTFNLKLISSTLLQTAVVAALSYILFLPFHNSFGAGFTEIALWKEATTGLTSYLFVYGLFIFLALVYIAIEFRAGVAQLSVRVREQLEVAAVPLLLGLAGLLFALTAALYLGYYIAIIAVPFIVLSAALALNPLLAANRRITLGLIAAGFGLTLLVEIFVIEGTVGRMNTVFKFYMQVWMLFSVVGGIGLARMLESSRRWGSIRRSTLFSILGILIFIAALYPVTATRAKWQIRMSDNAPRTLDGMAFMQTAQYDDSGQTVALAPDYEAIQWIQRNIEGSPTFAEAYSNNFYRSIGNRVAMYTGNPAIIGWSTHQGQQRAAVPNARVNDRIFDVQSLYNTPDVEQAVSLLQKYSVDYVYVGPLEQVYYSPDGLNKFEQMVGLGLLQTVYRQNGVTIYRVIAEAAAAN